MSRIMTIGENKSRSCSSCGCTRYKVLRTDATIVDAYGSKEEVEEGGPLIAVCEKCGMAKYIPWVDKINRKERTEAHNRIFDKLVRKGYKRAGATEVMEKYGVDAEDLDSIVLYSGFALDYSDDYEEGYLELLQDMYDIPMVFRNCIDCCYWKPEVEEIRGRLDNYYDNATELSKRVCDNLICLYGAEVVVFAGTKEEPFQITVNGTSIEESIDADNPIEVHYAIQRAVDKYEHLVQCGE